MLKILSHGWNLYLYKEKQISLKKELLNTKKLELWLIKKEMNLVWVKTFDIN
jgi:hypothetical protein